MASGGRRMTLPTIHGRVDPIHKAAQNPASDPAHGAAFILIHGLGDTAEGLANIADQFQSNGKLPHLHWILPNAVEHRDAMTTAWYTPSSLSPFPPDRPELAPTEDEEGLLQSVAYVESLIEACTNKSIPPHRIVLGGFSQGCALSLLTDLVSKKYSGRLAGVVGLMGYLPLAGGRRLEEMRAEAGLNPTVGGVEVFLARGQKDQMVPKRVHDQSVKKLQELGLTDMSLEVHEYEGVGHSLSGPVLKDVCSFLERIVPKLEDW